MATTTTSFPSARRVVAWLRSTVLAALVCAFVAALLTIVAGQAQAQSPVPPVVTSDPAPPVPLPPGSGWPSEIPPPPTPGGPLLTWTPPSSPAQPPPIAVDPNHPV